MAEQLLAVKDLRKTYETGKGAHKRVVEAARGVSFTLDRGALSASSVSPAQARRPLPGFSQALRGQPRVRSICSAPVSRRASRAQKNDAVERAASSWSSRTPTHP